MKAEEIKELIERLAKRYSNESKRWLSSKEDSYFLESALKEKIKSEVLYELLFEIKYKENEKYNIKSCGGE